MTIFHWLITFFWLILIAYWAVSAAGVKRSVRRQGGWKEVGLRLILVLVILLLLQIPALRQALQKAQAHVGKSMLLSIIGVGLCALGIGLALWARAHLGRNWGLPVTRKENPELITTGPYAVVRHPIYSGLLLAMLGSALAKSLFWLFPLLFFGAYFIYSARREEHLMIELFPDQYPAYMKRTKMLLPFLF